MSLAVQIENLGKRYRVNHAVERVEYQTLRETLVRAAAAPLRRLRQGPAGSCEDFWALRDVSFDVRHGEVVGIIGRNGAGKSTLLKVLSQITRPTTGCVKLYGRVASLLEVGTGFHQELTGRENIFLNGSILGMSRAEILHKFDEIVEFSGVERFLDTPVKRYSSGMKVRLAFSVAAHLEPEILIIDEVLAVGDAEFQKKCLGKMGDVARSGRTVLFVSHNMPAVRSLTTRAAYLESGNLVTIASTNSVITRYINDCVVARLTPEGQLGYFRRSSGEGDLAHFLRVWIDGPDHETDSLPVLRSGEDIPLCVEVELDEDLPQLCLSVILTKDHEERVMTLFSLDEGFAPTLSAGRHQLKCRISGLPLSPGRYTATFGMNRNANAKAYDVLLDVPMFEIVLEDLTAGNIDWPHRPWGAIHWRQLKWSIDAAPAS